MYGDYIFKNYSSKELRHALKRADAAIFEDVLRFLKDDLPSFGTGYIKEMMWKYIMRFELQPTHLELLETISLKCLERPMCREHKNMYQTMSRIASPEFWKAVKDRLNSDNTIVALNAYCLFPYSQGIYEGEKQRLILKRLKRYMWWGEGSWFKPLFVDTIKAIIYDRANWQDGQSIGGNIRSSHILGPSYDEEFIRIDWTQSIPEVLIPRLGQALSKCRPDIYSLRQSVDYVAYAMGKIAHPLAGPILINFLEQKVDWRFNSSAKQKIYTIICTALGQIGTPEALEAISNRQNA